MNSNILSTYATQPYVQLWSKYRPAILKLMIDSKEAPQYYQLFTHEFRAQNPKDKKALSFTLRVSHGKALNVTKGSVLAQDLLYVLIQSQKASALMQEDTYEFTLGRDCRLGVTRIAAL